MQAKSWKKDWNYLKRYFGKLVNKTDYNIQTTEIQNKIPEITSIATKAALNTKATDIANKIPDSTSHFVNNQEFNRLTKISFDARMKEAAKGLASKTEVDNALDIWR